MIRPLFLLSLLALAAIAALPASAQAEEGQPLARFRMDQLQQTVDSPGDSVGICSCAGGDTIPDVVSSFG